MTYNQPFLYRCQYNDGKSVDRQIIFGETGMERFYIDSVKSAQQIIGASVLVEYYDRRYRRWKPLVKYVNYVNIGEVKHNAENSARQDDFDLPAD